MTEHALNIATSPCRTSLGKDPAIQAIENYYAAEREWHATPCDTPECRAAERRWHATQDVLFKTPPTTPGGAAAFIDFALHDKWDWGSYADGADRAVMVAIRDILKAMETTS